MPLLYSLSSLFFFFVLDAQVLKVPLEAKVYNSDLIVEGKVLEKTTFRNNIDGYVYTENKIEIAKILKGVINENIVSVITRGGILNGVKEQWTHLAKLHQLEYGVFFLTKDKEFNNNFYRIYSSEQGFLKMIDSPTGSVFVAPYCRYSNIDTEIYNVIKDQDFQKSHIIDCKSIASRSNPNCLVIEAKPSNVNSFNAVFHFDIFASVLESPMFLKSGIIEVIYDTNQFGQDIVQNGKVILNNGPYLPSGDYTLNASDLAPGILEIRINSISNDRVLIDLFEKMIFNISIEANLSDTPIIFIDDNQVENDFVLLDPMDLLEQNPECVNLTIENPTTRVCDLISSFSPAEVAAGVNERALPGVSGATGTSGVLSIQGSGFGEPYPQFKKPHLSDVLFYNVDGNNFFPAAELNYISWSDTLIEVMVPTMEKDGLPSYSLNGVASTGKFIVSVTYPDGSICMDTSETDLIVQFGMFNDPWYDIIFDWQVLQNTFLPIDTVEGGKRRNLVNQNGIGGYDVFIEDMYPGDTDKSERARNQIMQVIDLWRCDYKINLNIVTDTTNLASPFFGKIVRGPLPFSTISAVMMKGESTETSITQCDSRSNVDSKIWDFVVTVNEAVLDTLLFPPPPDSLTITFNIDDAFPPPPFPKFGYIDMQRIMMHELGHCFQLRHTNNVSDIMAAGWVSTPSLNNIDRQYSRNDHYGALHIKDLSQEGACIWPAMIPYSGSECTTNHVHTIHNDLDFHLFPNPTTNSISIVFDELFNCNLEIYDLLGNQIENRVMGNVSNLEFEFPNYVSNGIYIIKISDLDRNVFTSRKVYLNK